MSKQTAPIRVNCQMRLKPSHGGGRCVNAATIGVYRWEPGDTDVNLDRPVAVVCGEHKRQFDYRRGQYLRNVELVR